MHIGFYALLNSDTWQLQFRNSHSGGLPSPYLLIQIIPDRLASKPANPSSSRVVDPPAEIGQAGRHQITLLSANPLAGHKSELPDVSGFIAVQQLERRPAPVSQPDIESLRLNQNISIPVIARLYIDSSGKVVEVRFNREFDPDAMQQIRNMFQRTLFIPGRRAGMDVASYVDIELSVTDLHRRLVCNANAACVYASQDPPDEPEGQSQKQGR